MDTSLQIPEGAQLAIVIVYTADNQVQVMGTIDNKVSALGLLETAKFAIIKAIDEKAAGKKIIAPAPGVAAMLDAEKKVRES